MVYNGDVPLRYVSLETKLSFDPMKQNPQKNMEILMKSPLFSALKPSCYCPHFADSFTRSAEKTFGRIGNPKKNNGLLIIIFPVIE
jgi:hypothetical protein